MVRAVYYIEGNLLYRSSTVIVLSVVGHGGLEVHRDGAGPLVPVALHHCMRLWDWRDHLHGPVLVRFT